MNKSEKLSFNVSARTARLIGRENVATPEGALIELVKNTYDADSDFCIVFFEIPYEIAPKKLGKVEYTQLKKLAKSYGTPLDNYYENKTANEVVRREFDLPSRTSLKRKKQLEKEYLEKNSKLNSFFRSMANIYIIDCGEGMSASTIKKNWMTIGTDNKSYEFLSKKGRAKSGEKGIGRFALDRLGQTCELTSLTKSSALKWSVDWESFEQKGKNINQVYANLSYERANHYELLTKLLSTEQMDTLKQSLKNRKKSVNLPKSLIKGTSIKISVTRDHWDRSSLKSIQKGLESLAPPSEDSSFQLFLFNDRFFEFNGLLQSDVCDDFDYKLVAKADENLNFEIQLTRNEFRGKDIPSKFFEREFSKAPRFSRKGFVKKKHKINLDIGKLIPGLRDTAEVEIDRIGSFSMTIYFLKKTSTGKDSDKYYLKSFDRNMRSSWLENNSGIKIFRDNFRIRPYGEPESSSWDWLDLGTRVNKDPAPAKRKGHWKVSPHNVSGTIEISRLDNPGLVDKSSREGLQETAELKLFKNIIIKLIKIFEDDRSTVFSELDAFYEENLTSPSDTDFTKKDKNKADRLAEKIFEGFKEKKSSGDSRKTDDEIIATAYLKEKTEKVDLESELDDMREENSLLRVFASSGVTIASFTHELENLQTKLGSRYTDIKSILSDYIDEEDFKNTSKFENPFYRISLFEKEDLKLKHWLQYTLRTIRKDKRNRKKIKLSNYFTGLYADWNETLKDRFVTFTIKNNTNDYNLRGYEIDLDCVFNNLIINSLDSFMRKGAPIDRNIMISLDDLSDGLRFVYKDTGAGLSKDISDPYSIFKATFTTKVDKNGKEIGTGMGMWLLKKTLEQYKAKVLIEKPKKGFEIAMTFPHLYENKR